MNLAFQSQQMLLGWEKNKPPIKTLKGYATHYRKKM
jgi:hypothetical protein